MSAARVDARKKLDGEAELLGDEPGLDGVTFLRVLRLLRVCFSAVFLLAAGVLL